MIPHYVSDFFSLLSLPDFISLNLFSGKKGTQGVLSICTNHWGGNIVHEPKTSKIDLVGERRATKYAQID